MHREFLLTTILFVEEFRTSSATLSPIRMLTPSNLLDLAIVNSQSKRGRCVEGGWAVSPTALRISMTGARPLASRVSANSRNFTLLLNCLFSRSCFVIVNIYTRAGIKCILQTII